MGGLENAANSRLASTLPLVTEGPGGDGICVGSCPQRRGIVHFSARMYYFGPTTRLPALRRIFGEGRGFGRGSVPACQAIDPASQGWKLNPQYETIAKQTWRFCLLFLAHVPDAWPQVQGWTSGALKKIHLKTQMHFPGACPEKSGREGRQISGHLAIYTKLSLGFDLLVLHVVVCENIFCVLGRWRSRRLSNFTRAAIGYLISVIKKQKPHAENKPSREEVQTPPKVFFKVYAQPQFTTFIPFFRPANVIAITISFRPHI